MSAHLERRILAEFVGTALLLIAVVGSGIAAQTLSLSDVGLALLENPVATGAALVAIILATLGLLLVVFGLVRSKNTEVAPFAVGAYITGAYFFTSSTSFANPAVTLARTLSNTFAGIRPSSAAAFVAFQLVGAAVAGGTIRFLYPTAKEIAPDVLVPHESTDVQPSTHRR